MPSSKRLRSGRAEITCSRSWGRRRRSAVEETGSAQWLTLGFADSLVYMSQNSPSLAKLKRACIEKEVLRVDRMRNQIMDALRGNLDFILHFTPKLKPVHFFRFQSRPLLPASSYCCPCFSHVFFLSLFIFPPLQKKMLTAVSSRSDLLSISINMTSYCLRSDAYQVVVLIF